MYLYPLLPTFLLLGVICVCGAESWYVPLDNEDVTSSIQIKRNDEMTSSKKLSLGHSCYEATFNSTIIEFCYPRIIVSGVAKAGTSAAYGLLAGHPNFIGGQRKELCCEDPNSSQSIWRFFKSMEAQTVKGVTAGMAPTLLISGCIQQHINIRMHRLLHQPNTVYILMTRDLSDLVWATYNFWCNVKYDGPDHCLAEKGHWADPRYHYRSPELFHELILAQAEYKHISVPFNYKLFSEESMGVFETHATTFLASSVSAEQLLVLASEELSTNATIVWEKVITKLGFSDMSLREHPSVLNFGLVRFNAGTVLVHSDQHYMSVV